MNRVKQVREARGMRREELATLADISYSYVARLESDEPPPQPTLPKARRLAAVLGVSVDELFPEPALEAQEA